MLHYDIIISIISGVILYTIYILYYIILYYRWCELQGKDVVMRDMGVDRVDMVTIKYSYLNIIVYFSINIQI